MASVFPSALDNLTANKGNSTPAVDDHPGHHNDLASAVNAIELEIRSGTTYNVKHRGATGDGVTDDTAAIQAVCDAAFAAGHRRIYFPHGRYLISSPILIYSNCVYCGDGTAFGTEIFSNSDIIYFQKHSSQTPLLSRATLEGLLLYPNANTTQPVIDASDWSQCSIKGLHIYKAGKGIRFTGGGSGSDVDVEDCLFTYVTTPLEPGEHVGLTVRNCMFLRDYAATGWGTTIIPQSIIQFSNPRSFQLEFTNCWWEQSNLYIDGAYVSVSGHFYYAKLALGPHSVHCDVRVSGDLLSRTITDLGWGNRIWAANGTNTYGGPDVVRKVGVLTTGTTKNITVTASTEYFFASSQMSAKDDDTADSAVITYYDNTGAAVVYQTEAGNTWGYGTQENEFYNKRREFSRHTSYELITTPVGCIQLRVYADRAGETDGLVDVLGFTQLLTNGDLKDAAMTAYSSTGWTIDNVVGSAPVNGFVTLTGTGNWRLYQSEANLTPGALYGIYAKWKNNVGGTRLLVQNGQFGLSDAQGILLNVLMNPQTQYQVPNSGYIAAGYFVPGTATVYVNIQSPVSSTLDIAWVALVRLD